MNDACQQTDFEQLKRAFPNLDPHIVYTTLQKSRNLEDAINTILNHTQEQQHAQINQVKAPIPSRFNSTSFRPQKIPPKSHLDHLFLPGRLLSVEMNLNMFGTFSGEVSDQVIPQKMRSKSQDPKFIQPLNSAFSTSIIPDEFLAIKSTPLMNDSYSQFLPWTPSRFSSGPSWRCSFSSDNCNESVDLDHK